MSLLVEASAGTGKTHSLVERLAQALVEDRLCPSQVAAVTFTRKAAAELRGRLRLRLEQAALDEEVARQALARFDRLFVGTVHSFCGMLLRMYPVEAGLGPDFEELEPAHEQLLQHLQLRKALDEPGGRGLRRLLQDLGASPQDVSLALNWMCDHGEVDYPAPVVDRPDLQPAWLAVDAFSDILEGLMPDWDPGATCGLLHLTHRLSRTRRLAQRETPGDLLALLQEWNTLPKPVKRYWGQTRLEQNARLEQLQQAYQSFRQDWVEDYLGRWQSHLYASLVALLSQVREQCRTERIARGQLSFHDLLYLTARLLRSQPSVRADLQQRLTLLCVDEFQDTDPLQAEIFFLLASQQSDEPRWKCTRPRPGSLFLVGDPKQSIYRFRRADVQVYRESQQHLLQQGGSQRSLVHSYRSVPELCQWINRTFAQLFEGAKPDYQGLTPTRPAGQSPALWVLPTTCERLNDVAAQDARNIAGQIQRWCDGGEYQPSDFLILTMKKADMAVYQQALKAAGLACEARLEPAPLSPRARSLLRLLQALSRPEDRIALVGLLRGEFFGHSDPELFQQFSGGGHPEVEQTLAWLDGLREEVSSLTPGACLKRVLLRLGLSWENDRENRALVDALGSCAEAGWTLHESCQELLEQDAVVLPPQADESQGVRLLNLHRAKGLEARVVFLASPTHGLPRQVEHAVRRGPAGPEGAFCLRKHRRVLARPADWGGWEEAEREQLEHEHLRLLYVACTRAGERLIVSQWTDPRPGLSRPWEPLDPFLADCPRLVLIEPQNRVCDDPGPGLDGPQLQRSLAEQEARFQRCFTPSWRRHSVTSNPSQSQPIRQQAPPDFSPGGVAWGDLMHRLLEKMVAHPDWDRAQLERLARWYAFEVPELQGHLDTALDTLERVRQTPFWEQVQSARQRLVEVPFAQRSDKNWLFGTMDLVLDRGQDWEIVDYKTDRKSLDDLVAHYASQVQQYARSWQDITEESVGYAGLFGLREGRLSQDLRG